MRRWLRVTMPPGWAAIGLIVYSGFEMAAGPRVNRGANDPDPAAIVLNALCVFYGAFRGFARHPAFHPEYARWLRSTPWNVRLPLPDGPIHLVPQDLVYLGTLMGLAWWQHSSVAAIGMATGFLGVYEAVLAVTFALLRWPVFAYIIAYGLGGVSLCAPYPSVALAMGSVLYGVCLWGLKRSLGQFANWDFDRIDGYKWKAYTQQNLLAAQRDKLLGWPFDVLRPREVSYSLSGVHATLLCLLVGWWLFVLYPRDGEERVLTVFVVLASFGLMAGSIITRLALYTTGYSSPINFWGRLFTLRWIIVGYDKLFLAPLMAVGTMLGAFWLMDKIEIPWSVGLPLVTTAVLLIISTTPPSLANWRLTGQHRMSPKGLMANHAAELKEI